MANALCAKCKCRLTYKPSDWPTVRCMDIQRVHRKITSRKNLAFNYNECVCMCVHCLDTPARWHFKNIQNITNVGLCVLRNMPNKRVHLHLYTIWAYIQTYHMCINAVICIHVPTIYIYIYTSINFIYTYFIFRYLQSLMFVSIT